MKHIYSKTPSNSMVEFQLDSKKIRCFLWDNIIELLAFGNLAVNNAILNDGSTIEFKTLESTTLEELLIKLDLMGVVYD